MSRTCLHLCLALTLLTFASSAMAECHISNAVPRITSWTVTPIPGAIVVDARFKPFSNPGATYFNPDPNGDAFWEMWVVLDAPVGALDLSHPTFTDTTFHALVPVAAATYPYRGSITGDEMAEAELCPVAYEISGTITVPPDTKQALHASGGAHKTTH